MKKLFKNVLLVLAVVIVTTFVTGCGAKKEGIVGVWKYDGGDYTYTFKEDGTGNYNALGTVMEFTYETEGNKLSITYTGNTSPFETEYTIDGDTLNIKDSFGSDTIYKRK